MLYLPAGQVNYTIWHLFSLAPVLPYSDDFSIAKLFSFAAFAVFIHGVIAFYTFIFRHRPALCVASFSAIFEYTRE